MQIFVISQYLNSGVLQRIEEPINLHTSVSEGIGKTCKITPRSMHPHSKIIVFRIVWREKAVVELEKNDKS